MNVDNTHRGCMTWFIYIIGLLLSPYAIIWLVSFLTNNGFEYIESFIILLFIISIFLGLLWKILFQKLLPEKNEKNSARQEEKYVTSSFMSQKLKTNPVHIPQPEVEILTQSSYHVASHSMSQKLETDPVNTLQPEEMVVEYVLDFLQNRHGFDRDDIKTEFPIQMGSASKRADIVIFSHNMPHRQENIYIIIECKRADRSYNKHHIAQLKSYMSACMNVRFGVLAASEWRVWDRVRTHSGFQFEERDYLPDISNKQAKFTYNPPTP